MFIESKRLEENGRSFRGNTYAKMSSTLMTYNYAAKANFERRFNIL